MPVGTEAWNRDTEHISEVSAEEMLTMINREDQKVAGIVKGCIPQIAELVEAGVRAIQSGHRIFYCGAGTSGRLAIADAAECPPTYGLDPTCFTAVMAGGNDAVFRASEGAEDSFEAGARTCRELGCAAGDLVLGISVSGQAPFVCAFMEQARAAGCTVAALVNNEGAPMTKLSDITIVADTGAEAIKGSTRMKGGTAQKMILNMFSTAVCVKLGCVYKNYMVNIRPANRKLRQRAVDTVSEITGADQAQAQTLLDAHNWSIREAVEAVARGDEPSEKMEKENV